MSILKVMTLNVRQPDQDDGLNCWDNRRALLVETILSAGPDLIGTQELFTLQAEYIHEHAPQYAWFGTGRFGDARDKHVGIFYRRDHLRLLDHGDFWLSETPEAPGSSSWDIIRPRQVTWGHFELPAGERFYHFNTHFPYRSVEQEARRRTADLILARTSSLGAVVLTADFNAPADGEIHQTLCAHYSDAWLTTANQVGPEGTLNGFGRHTGSRRIDWILYRAPWKAIRTETISARRDGIYPSDHFPVVAHFEAVP